TSGVLDRALDVAAALEVRGYGAARRPPPARKPYSRHDLAFASSALALVALAIGARIAGLVKFTAYPSLHAPVGAGGLAVAACRAAGWPPASTGPASWPRSWGPSSRTRRRRS